MKNVPYEIEVAESIGSILEARSDHDRAPKWVLSASFLASSEKVPWRIFPEDFLLHFYSSYIEVIIFVK